MSATSAVGVPAQPRRHDAGTSRDSDPRLPRHRLAALMDDGTLELISADDDSGMVAATGLVHGSRVVAFCSDASVMGGAMGDAGCRVVVEAYHRALADGVPIIGLWHSGGARLAEGVLSLHAVGRIFHAMTQASGKVPQISVVLGPAAGGAAYGPALTDVVILGPEGRIFVTGPDVVRSVTGEDVDMLRLGGPEPHGRRSGVVHVLTESEQEALDRARELGHPAGHRRGRWTCRRSATSTSARCCRSPGAAPTTCTRWSKESSTRGPRSSSTRAGPPTSRPSWAVSAGGRWASSPTTRCASAAASTPRRPEKAARFVRMCDAFGIPLVVLVDVPGYLPGVGQEWDGVVRRGAKLLHAFSECVVPRVTLVTRKTYGGAYIAMNARSLGATRVFAWPGAEVAVMGSVAAIRVLHRRRLAELPPEIRAQVETELAAEHEVLAGGVDRAVEIGVVDEVVAPERTRSALAGAIADEVERHGVLRGIARQHPALTRPSQSRTCRPSRHHDVARQVND